MRGLAGEKVTSRSLLQDIGGALGQSGVGLLRNTLPKELEGRPDTEVELYRSALAAGLSKQQALTASRNSNLNYLAAGNQALANALREAGVDGLEQLDFEKQAEILETAFPQPTVTVQQIEGTAVSDVDLDRPSAATKVARSLSAALVKGAEATNEIIDLVGEKNAERALFLGSAALGGLPKALFNYVAGDKIGEFQEKLLGPVTARVSRVIGENAFDARDSVEYQAVKPVSDVLADFTLGLAFTAVIGIGAKGAVGGIRCRVLPRLDELQDRRRDNRRDRCVSGN